MSEKNSIAFPLVSIIIRSIDRSTLADALESVALQTYPNIEVIIVNAKGADHREVSEWCGNFPIRMVDSDQPLGRSRAANAGLDKANGKYLIFLDDDDWFEADHIAKLADALVTHPACFAAHTGIACVNEAKQITPQIFAQPFDAILLMTINFMPIHAVLFSRHLIEVGCLMDETLDYYEDWDFWLQASLLSDFIFIPGVSGYYRMYNSSGVHQQKSFSGTAYARIYDKWRNRWPVERVGKLMGTFWHMHIAQTQMEQELVDSRTQLTDTNKQLNHAQIQLTHTQTQLADVQIQLSDAQMQLSDAQMQLSDAQMQLSNVQMQLTDTQAQLTGCHAELNIIYRSRSWYITAPLRQFNLIIKNFFSRS
ncbi:glycosyltransferase [Nitrosomonas sp. Nm166]|uniref:glycosyltransferase n=1 Tax=Nitrosomonas sp. Nm166 TaxID=1881054 RepID=UPI0008F0D0D0|nr:glycosyltransferase [Nitrosomonas sp. Nm166]SFE96544.1 Glycosyltransferase, GT2 family [Nitrosomonas sp. Nm166]